MLMRQKFTITRKLLLLIFIHIRQVALPYAARPVSHYGQYSLHCNNRSLQVAQLWPRNRASSAMLRGWVTLRPNF